MSTIAVIIAGGSGSRMGQDIPKQFINVYDKPVLIYTLEGFQKHPQIDAIEVVCIDGWHDVLWAYARQFGISKLKWVVSGGKTGQESIRNGVFHLEGKAEQDDIIIVHDGIRPLVDESVLTDGLDRLTDGHACRRFAAFPLRRPTSSACLTQSTMRRLRKKSASTALPTPIR